MNYYYNTETNSYPRYVGDIQLECPDWNSEMPLPPNWVEVEFTDPPEHDEFDLVTIGQPILDNGIWKQTWITKPMEDWQIKKKQYWKKKFEERVKNPEDRKPVIFDEENIEIDKTLFPINEVIEIGGDNL